MTVGVSSVTLSSGAISETYVFSTTEDVTAKHVLLVNNSTPSQNVLQTCQSLIRVINRQSSGKFYAEYISGTYDLPGKMRIWARSLATPVFYMTCDTGTTGNDFSPVLPISGTLVASNASAQQNRLYYSQYLQPECVPLGNYLDIGTTDSAILRIIALVNSLIVVKDEGLWYISGLSAPWTVSKLNISTRCIAANSVVALNNKVFMLTNQGVVMASEAGVQIISAPIENLLNYTYTYSNLASCTHAVGWESNRMYILWMPSTNYDTYATQAYCYNFLVNGWTRWTKPAQCGLIEKLSNNLYISSGVENTILVANNYNNPVLDYSDETKSGNILATYTDGSLDIQFGNLWAGHGIYQGGRMVRVLTSTIIGVGQWHATVDLNLYGDLSVGACQIKSPINSSILFHPNPCGESGVSKNFLDVNFAFDGNTISVINAEFNTNQQSVPTIIKYTNQVNTGWGLTEWGSNWGNSVNIQSPPFRIIVPQPQTYGEYLTIGFTHAMAGEGWTLTYASILYDQSTSITNFPNWA